MEPTLVIGVLKFLNSLQSSMGEKVVRSFVHLFVLFNAYGCPYT